MGPSRDELAKAESFLRRYDKALRLRFSIEQPYTVLIERKTFRGRIGALLKTEGVDYAPDAGYRQEVGHIPIASMRASDFDQVQLLEALKSIDTWRRDEPMWRTLDKRDGDHGQYEHARRRMRRQSMLTERTGGLWDRYVWKYKQRVNVPVQVS